jgi:putative endonuclease
VALWSIVREPTSPYHAVDLGRRGEAAAARLVETLGFRIVERGYRTPRGEVDLVAFDRDTLVFIEVKTRSSGRCGDPAEAVGARKRVRLRRAAAWFLAHAGGPERPCRFDVVEVKVMPGGELRARLIRDAF